MRVLLFTDADVFAGTERHIFDLASALQVGFKDEVAVRVACPVPAPLAERCREAGIEVVAIAKRGLIDLNAVRQLRRMLKSGRVDLIHAHNGRTALCAALAVTLARRGQFVMTQHFLSPNHTSQSGLKGAISGRAHGWVSRKAALFIAISQAVRNAMIERGEVEKEKIAVVLNGVPDAADTSNRVLDEPQSVREKFGVGVRPLIVCAARLEAEKGLETLVAAMQTVRQAQPEALCLIAGDGSLHDELQGQIERAQLGDNVRLIGFQVDVLALVNAADVFVLSSLSEPFGLAIIEAMSLGKPVVATRSGGPLEIVANGESGILVAPSSSEDMAQALLRLLGNETERDQMGQAARERYVEHFTSERMAREMVAAYRLATGGK